MCEIIQFYSYFVATAASFLVDVVSSSVQIEIKIRNPGCQAPIIGVGKTLPDRWDVSRSKAKRLQKLLQALPSRHVRVRLYVDPNNPYIIRESSYYTVRTMYLSYTYSTYSYDRLYNIRSEYVYGWYHTDHPDDYERDSMSAPQCTYAVVVLILSIQHVRIKHAVRQLSYSTACHAANCCQLSEPQATCCLAVAHAAAMLASAMAL